MSIEESGGVPGQPDPPVLEKATHHSVELSWHPPPHSPEDGRLRYCVQEEDASRKDGFGNVYNGYATSNEFTGLNVMTQYKYRLRAINDVGPGPWSPVVTVATTRQPKSSENLHKALRRGDIEMVQSILQTNPHYIDIPDIHGAAPLMSACCLGKKELVKLLLDLGADVEYRNSSGKTSLMEACYRGHLESAKLIVSHGGSWLTRDHSGFSALHYAVDGGHLNVIAHILNEGVPADDVTDVTLSGWTPLLRTASLEGNTAVAKMLIQHGADASRKDKEGKTVLMLAALNGHEELVKLLLDNGANPFVKNQFGKSAVDFAQSFERHATSKLFEQWAAARKEKLGVN